MCLKSMIGEAEGGGASQARAMTLLSLAWGMGTGERGSAACLVMSHLACFYLWAWSSTPAFALRAGCVNALRQWWDL